MSNQSSGPLHPPPEHTQHILALPPSDRLRRIRGVIEAVSDALQHDGNSYSPHLGRRAEALELVSAELASVTDQLEGGES